MLDKKSKMCRNVHPGVYNRPISISMITNMQEFNIGISMSYGVIVIVICYISLAVIFKLDKKRFM